MKNNLILIKLILIIVLLANTISTFSMNKNNAIYNAKLNEYGTTFLHSAVYYGGNPSLVQILLNKKETDIDTQDIYGNSALHSAISLGASANIILQLLNSGADINIRNKKGHTSLDLAKQTSRKDVIEYLIKWPKIIIEKIKKDTDPYLYPDLANIIGEYLVGEQKPV